MNDRSRQRIKFVACVAMCSFYAGFAVGQTPIVLTQIADFSSRGKAIALPVSAGARACIAEHNASGRAAATLVTHDDRFLPEETRRLAAQALRDGTTAFIASLGSANALALADVADPAGVPVVGAIAGATSVRSAQRSSLFFVRASLRHEAEHATKHLAATGMRRIGVLHTADAFGKDGLDAVRNAAATLKLESPVAASYDPATATDAAAAVDALKSRDAVIVFGSSKILYDFVIRMRRDAPGVVLVTSSAGNMTDLVDKVGITAARGVRYLRSLPMPSERTALGRSFREAWRRYGDATEPGPFHLEGCIAARIALRAATSVGSGLTPAKMLRKLKSSGPETYGEFIVDFRKVGNEGSSWVDIAVIDANGKLRD
jgi:branched-chain amino acid transport system substrate-binding protein